MSNNSTTQAARLFREGETPTTNDKQWLRELALLGATDSPTFSGVTATTFTGNLTGNADTSTKLATARQISGVDFDGSANITVPALGLGGTTLASNVITSSLTTVGTLTNLTVTNTITGTISGNSGTTTKLATARKINGVDFDGTQDISITSGSITSNSITDSTAPGRALLTAATAKAQVTLLTTVVDNANTSITLADSDSGTVIRTTAGTTVTVTIPSTLAAGFCVAFIQGGAGQINYAAGSGATVNSYVSMLKSAGQYAAQTVTRVAAGTFNLSGNITV